MSRYDPTGSMVVEMRLDAAILASVGGNPKQIGGGEDRRNPPDITPVFLGSTPTPFGAGSGRLGLTGSRYAVRCRAPKGPEGDIQASQMAGAVALFFHNRGWRTRTIGGSRWAIAQSKEESTGPVYKDPDTQDPTVTVFVSLVAAAQAVT